ncbi:hypothetical protein ACRRTK_020063 [Alexandromys fortis]
MPAAPPAAGVAVALELSFTAIPGAKASTKKFPGHGVAVRECADSCAKPNSHLTSGRSSCNPKRPASNSVCKAAAGFDPHDQADDLDRCKSAVEDLGQCAAKYGSRVWWRVGAYGEYGSTADDRRDKCGAGHRDDGGKSAPDTTTNTQAWSTLKQDMLPAPVHALLFSPRKCCPSDGDHGAEVPRQTTKEESADKTTGEKPLP